MPARITAGGDVEVAWSLEEEYDFAARWCARAGLKGEAGDPLPEAMFEPTCRKIDDDPAAFAELIQAYARDLAAGRTVSRYAQRCPKKTLDAGRTAC